MKKFILSAWASAISLGALSASPALATAPTVPLSQVLPGAEIGLMAIAAAGVVGGILIARRKR